LKFGVIQGQRKWQHWRDRVQFPIMTATGLPITQQWKPHDHAVISFDALPACVGQRHTARQSR